MDDEEEEEVGSGDTGGDDNGGGGGGGTTDEDEEDEDGACSTTSSPCSCPCSCSCPLIPPLSPRCPMRPLNRARRFPNIVNPRLADTNPDDEEEVGGCSPPSCPFWGWLFWVVALEARRATEGS